MIIILFVCTHITDKNNKRAAVWIFSLSPLKCTVAALRTCSIVGQCSASYAGLINVKKPENVKQVKSNNTLIKYLIHTNFDWSLCHRRDVACMIVCSIALIV